MTHNHALFDSNPPAKPESFKLSDKQWAVFVQLVKCKTKTCHLREWLRDNGIESVTHHRLDRFKVSNTIQLVLWKLYSISLIYLFLRQRHVMNNTRLHPNKKAPRSQKRWLQCLASKNVLSSSRLSRTNVRKIQRSGTMFNEMRVVIFVEFSFRRVSSVHCGNVSPKSSSLMPRTV